MDSLKTIGVALMSAFGGYVAGVPLGMFLAEHLSANRHDRSTEAAMTAALVIGPLIALVAGVGGVAVYHHLRQAS
jgi:hypothetical protein